MVECMCCGNHMKKIGSERKNGKTINNKTGKDWNTRKFCKKCFKKLKEHQNNIIFNTYISEDLQNEMLRRFKKKWNLEKLL